MFTGGGERIEDTQSGRKTDGYPYKEKGKNPPCGKEREKRKKKSICQKVYSEGERNGTGEEKRKTSTENATAT